MAFFSLIREGSRIALFCTDHSPWSFKLNNNECLSDFDLNAKQILEKINIYCHEKNLHHIANIKNTLIVRTL